LQLASYLGIPVIAWNADNSGLERRVRHLYNNNNNLATNDSLNESIFFFFFRFIAIQATLVIRGFGLCSFDYLRP
jgi:hypothetical protein